MFDKPAPMSTIDVGRRLWVDPRAVLGGALWAMQKMPSVTSNDEYLELGDKLIDALRIAGYRIVREQTADGLPQFAETKIDTNS